MDKTPPQNNKMPYLSVVIPALNEATQLPGLLDALKSQTQPPNEIIVADAGSKDGTVEAALERGARVVPGGMPGPGRNAGARAAQGEIFLFLDADVLPAPDFLELALDEFERDQYVVATCPSKALSDDLSDKIIMEATNLYLQIIMPVSPRAPGYCIFAQRAVHEAIGGFDETLKMSEDHDYVRRASQHGEFGLLTSAHIPVSMRRLEKEGLVGLALKYLWCEMYALAGKPIRSMPFEYEFGAHQPAAASTGHYLIDVAELRAQLGRFENPIQNLSAAGLKRIEQIVNLDWLNVPLERIHLQIESPDATILYRYLTHRLELIHQKPQLRNDPLRHGWTKLKALPYEGIRLLETHWPWGQHTSDTLPGEPPSQEKGENEAA
jgi:glycosyltransferase involved in cell wall biosynthesis